MHFTILIATRFCDVKKLEFVNFSVIQCLYKDFGTVFCDVDKYRCCIQGQELIILFLNHK